MNTNINIDIPTDNMPWDKSYRDAQDARRYRVIAELIGSSTWPVDVVSMARDGKDLTSLVDTKLEELQKIAQEYGVAI